MKVVYSIKVMVKNYQLDLKGFLNLSQTMKFVLDFCHRLSIGKNPVLISWSETNLKTL